MDDDHADDGNDGDDDDDADDDDDDDDVKGCWLCRRRLELQC